MKKLITTTVIALFLFSISVTISRSFRVEKIPNGNKFSCANCHISPSGGGPRNSFGKAVESRVTPGGFQDFWDSDLASLDSDGDGFSNGVELQDPNGTWRPGQPNPGNSNQVSNPGDPNSKPSITLVETTDYPYQYKLFDNYPNPFNPETIIRYQLPVAGKVILKVYDILGNEIASLLNEYKEAGNYEITFYADKYNLQSGVYLYRLQSGYFSETKKMLLIK